ncbi:hypothetical protein [Streptomyces nigrescens]|uniref:hypothetical protein n=1 Tax=Streptomyces nigrescens TaxID=1920 RepID=UPI003F4CD566
MQQGLDHLVHDDKYPIRIADRPGWPHTPTRLLGFGTVADTSDITKVVFAARLRELGARRGADTECSPGYAGETRLCTVSRVPDAMACIGDSGGPQIQRGKGGPWSRDGTQYGRGRTRTNWARPLAPR